MLDFCSANRAENLNNTSSILSVLINGMCNFEDVIRAATAASKSSVGLDVKYENAWRSVA